MTPIYGNKDIEYELDKFPSEFRSIKVYFEKKVNVGGLYLLNLRSY